MYNKTENKEILNLLSKIDKKLNDNVIESNFANKIMNNMQNKTDNKEILDLLSKIDKKLNDNVMDSNSNNETKNVKQFSNDDSEIIYNLTQKQYELSSELLTGIETLKKLINETEKYTCKAKSKYQK